MGDGKVTLTYKLDGTESRNMMMGRGGQLADLVSTASGTAPGSRLSPSRRWAARSPSPLTSGPSKAAR